MSLTNSQYDRIMRMYSQRELEANRDLEKRRAAVYAAIPAMSDLDAQIASGAVSRATALLEHDAEKAVLFRKKMQEASSRRRELLAEHHFPADVLEPRYQCPDCRDTGYIGSRKCHCFRKAVIDLLYTQSGLKTVLEEENFSHFQFDYYPDQDLNPVTQMSSRENMHRIVGQVRLFLQTFDENCTNLFFFGGTGLGKTFLSHCIAKELLDTAHSVVYFSAYDLFEQMARTAFGKETDAPLSDELLYESDLLILDDLGTELTNAFVSSRLFLLLNERILRKKSIIISTNLSLQAFSDMYSERVFSRITSHFELLGFYGNDIRLQKKIQTRG